MKKVLLALAAIAVLGGSSLALGSKTDADACGPCDPAACEPCPGCPCP